MKELVQDLLSTWDRRGPKESQSERGGEEGEREGERKRVELS